MIIFKKALYEERTERERTGKGELVTNLNKSINYQPMPKKSLTNKR